MPRPAKIESARTASLLPATGSQSSHRLIEGDSPLPLYHRLYVILRERIISGVYRNGKTLPTENALMEAFGVSRITARRALNDLAAEGLVVRARGRGTIVSYEHAAAMVGSPVLASIDGLMANLSVIGHGTTVNVRTLEYIRAGDYVAGQLQISPDTTVQHVSRVRYLHKLPFSYSQSYLLESIGQSFSQQDLLSHSLIELILRAGVQIERVQQSITCTLADDVSASLLQTNVGSPLLKLRRVFIDDNDRPVNYSEVLYTPDRFEYRMNWSRGADNELRLDPTPNQI